MIAGLDRLHARADRLDDTRGFVAEHDGQLRRRGRLDDGEVGVTQPAVVHPHPHQAGAGFSNVEIVDERQCRIC